MVIQANKSGIVKPTQTEEEKALELSKAADDKKFVEEEIGNEYYTRVKSSDTFYRRKRLILENLEILENKVKY